MEELKNFLLKILEVINYPDNKDDFINKFLGEAYLQTIDQLLKTLPTDKQPLIIQHLESTKTPELLQQAVNSQFDKAIFESMLLKTIQDMFADYLKTIDTALSLEQKQKLQHFFASSQNIQS